MRRLVVSRAARRDLVAIGSYVLTTSGSVRVARAFIARLHVRCTALAALPGTLGAGRPEIGHGIRTVAERDHLIAFRYEPGLLRILRVIEGHRDVTGLIQPSEDR